MGLEDKQCIPCGKGAAALSPKQVAEHLRELDDWQASSDSTSIRRDYKCRNFKQALDFVNKVGEVAEGQKHHPDITFGWGYVTLTLQTHAIGGLHENDFILAAKVNRILL